MQYIVLKYFRIIDFPGGRIIIRRAIIHDMDKKFSRLGKEKIS
jgi:hypothetical protein